MNPNTERLSLPDEDSISSELGNMAAPDEAIKQNDDNYKADASTESIEDKEMASLIKSSLEKQSLHESAPEGWFPIGSGSKDNKSGLVKELGLSHRTIKKAINRYPPIQGKDYRGSRGGLHAYYPLAEVAERVGGLSSAKFAPEGWFPVGIESNDKKSGLVKELGVSIDTIRKAINLHPPLQGGDYRDSRGVLLTHYPIAEVAERVERIEHLKSTESAPEGWLPVGSGSGDDDKKSGLVKELGVTRGKIIEAINMNPPIRGKDYKNSKGTLLTHYPLAEVAERVERLRPTESAPEGWFLVGNESGDKKSGLVKELGVSHGVIINAINMNPPIQGKDYRDSRGTLRTHYPLAEVAARVEHLTSTESAPEGWLTTNGLASKLGVSHETVRKAIERLGIEEKEYRDDNGNIRIFYSPEKQAAIMEELENSTAGASFPETTFYFYIKQVVPNAVSRLKPKWLRGPLGGQMEIDIYFELDDPPRKIGIEYDGMRYHDEIRKPSDIHKNELASEHGVQIIRIRENGCPDLPDNIPCINRQSNKKNELVEPIEQLLNMLNIPLPEKGIDIKRDKKAINELMRQLKGIQELDAAENKEKLSLVA